MTLDDDERRWFDGHGYETKPEYDLISERDSIAECLTTWLIWRMAWYTNDFHDDDGS